MTKKQRKGSIEETLNRLTEIVETLESGEVSLDEALNLFEEGVHLTRECSQKLRAAELRVQKLVKTLEGEFELMNVSPSNETIEEEYQ
ncbi:MAG: exodeoxyribonuclease VII small subunit [Bacteroidetes bacterium]|nr:exodeoxyribonuclease VII small subunit [Bacteroidota bacterium]